MTLPEVLLWQRLRTRPGGVKFRRQHPIGPYVLDFYAPAARIAIEIDGMTHELGDRPQRDARRDAWLEEQDIMTIRVAAVEVLRDPDAVVVHLLDRCTIPLHRPADGPPPHARHGEDL
ncbi:MULTISPECIES: endonuclease domain-containing protein [unclassified Sphingomonas]|nr:endonuclease domain-containing protein [Sphingomonas sp. SFZ2018-12]